MVSENEKDTTQKRDWSYVLYFCYNPWPVIIVNTYMIILR